MSGLVRPTHDDPVARAASESVGGPVGRRAAPHPWWTPVRVVLQEAIRLSERYGTARSARFVNGVLDAYARNLGRL